MSVIKYPVSTEKAIRMMESENKLTFIVKDNATKKTIKEEIENMFKTKVVKVNTINTMDGRKKAYVMLSPESPAIDVATQLGLM